ncbi:hypothetical protein EVAR_29616_1 [Eumeta japonica]|uniref:Uncharacterized protein n=1 Tax=Eumeta variegata TaxID=151549 RepID=A0A4C1VWY8_EUMVA|nr:hypothetical protein EVAR_29616_1 [Eumeta japonica]
MLRGRSGMNSHRAGDGGREPVEINYSPTAALLKANSGGGRGARPAQEFYDTKSRGQNVFGVVSSRWAKFNLNQFRADPRDARGRPRPRLRGRSRRGEREREFVRWSETFYVADL